MVENPPRRQATLGNHHSRDGKREIRSYVESPLHKLLRVLAAEEDSTIEALVREALQRSEDAFRKRLKRIRDEEFQKNK